MGKKSSTKQWVVKYKDLPVVEVSAKTEGAAKTQIFRFLLKERLIGPHERQAFMNQSRVGILKKEQTNEQPATL